MLPSTKRQGGHQPPPPLPTQFPPLPIKPEEQIGEGLDLPPPPCKKGAPSLCHGIPTAVDSVPAFSEEAGPDSIPILPPGLLGTVSHPLDMGPLSSPWEGVALVHAPALVFAGRLCMFMANWRRITVDPWVLAMVAQGYRLPLTNTQFQQKPPHFKPSNVERDMIAQEVTTLLQKQAIQTVAAVGEDGFYSMVFTVPKKGESEDPSSTSGTSIPSWKHYTSKWRESIWFETS